MLIAVTGATGVLGSRAVAALVSQGYDVRALSRSDRGDRLLTRLGAQPVRASLFDADALTTVFEGCDVVANLATHIPVGLAGWLPGAWRVNTKIRTEGIRAVTTAADRAGVRRLVQESVSYVYADRGESWIDEDSALEITDVIEPVAVAETAAQTWSTRGRSAVVLRFGAIVGSDPMTRWQLDMVRRKRPVGLGEPEGFAHVVHTSDLGGAVAAAMHAPAGTYNVGAQPVRRSEVVEALGRAVGVESTGFLGPVARRIAGPRCEALSRSLRVCGDRLTAQTGWSPRRAVFDVDWLAQTVADDEFAGLA